MAAYFISGATSGLGEAVARRLAARGDTVAAAARRQQELRRLAAEVAGCAGTLTTHQLDVTDHASVDRVMRHADAVHGGFDVVVVNAGRGGGSRLGTGGFEKNRAVLEVNLMGALAQIETAMALFRDRDRGHLVLISSLAAARAMPGSGAVYSASKAALARLGRSLRTELTGTQISVTTIRPGYIRTPLTEGNRSPLMSGLEPAAVAIVKAIDRRQAEAVVPGWPWRPIGILLRVVPHGLIRRFAG